MAVIFSINLFPCLFRRRPSPIPWNSSLIEITLGVAVYVVLLYVNISLWALRFYHFKHRLHIFHHLRMSFLLHLQFFILFFCIISDNHRLLFKAIICRQYLHFSILRLILEIYFKHWYLKLQSKLMFVNKLVI